MSIFDQFAAEAQQPKRSIFDRFAEEAKQAPVQPGDVEARRKQVAAIDPWERPVQKERSIGDVFESGVEHTLKGVINTIADPMATIKPVMNALTGRGGTGFELLKGVLSTPPMQAMGGAAEIVMSPTQPARETIARGMENLQEAVDPYSPMAAAGLAAAGEAIGNVGMDVAIGGGSSVARKAIAKRLPTRAEQAAKLQYNAQGAVMDVQNRGIEQTRQLERLREAQRQQVLDVQREQVRPTRQAMDDLQANAAAAPNAESVGQRFKTDTYPKKLKASQEKFNERYGEVLEEAKGVTATTDGYAAKIEEILGPNALSRPVATRAEAAAQKAKGLLDAEDATYAELKGLFKDPARSDNAALIKRMADEVGIQPGQPVTANQLIKARQSYKAAERAALDAGNDPLHWQYKQLREGLEADISKHPTIKDRLSTVDDAYREEHVPYFGVKSPTRDAANKSAETVVDRFIPRATDPKRVEKATRAFELTDNPQEVTSAWLKAGVETAQKKPDFGKSYAEWFAQFEDPKTSDKVLKLWLGDSYQHHKDIVTRLRTVKPKSVDTQVRQALASIDKRIAEKQGVATKRIDAELQAIHNDIAEQSTKLIGRPYDPQRMQGYGMLLLGGGTSALASGATAMAGPAIAKGIMMIMTAEHVAALLNSTRGASLLRRAMRAIPGTSQAAATGRQIQAFFKEQNEEY